MFDVFGSVKSLLKLDAVNIDNNVFRLHYKATVIILVAFSLLVTSRQYIGDPIDCIVDQSIGGDIMDTYCWIHSTYTVPEHYDSEIGKCANSISVLLLGPRSVQLTKVDLTLTPLNYGISQSGVISNVTV